MRLCMKEFMHACRHARALYFNRVKGNLVRSECVSVCQNMPREEMGALSSRACASVIDCIIRVWLGMCVFVCLCQCGCVCVCAQVHACVN